MHERKVGTLAACFIGYRYSIISSHHWFAGRATKHLQRSGLLWVFLVWDFSRWEDASICRVQTGIKLNNWKQTTQKTPCFWNIWELLLSTPFALGIEGLVAPHWSQSSIKQSQICFKFCPAVHGSESKSLKRHFWCSGHICAFMPRAPRRRMQNGKLIGLVL